MGWGSGRVEVAVQRCVWVGTLRANTERNPDRAASRCAAPQAAACGAGNHGRDTPRRDAVACVVPALPVGNGDRDAAGLLEWQCCGTTAHGMGQCHEQEERTTAPAKHGGPGEWRLA